MHFKKNGAMSGSKLLMDSNVIMYLLNGDTDVAEIINGKQVYLSFISQLELLGYGGLTDVEKERIIGFFNDINTHIIDINAPIKDLVIDIRQNNRVKLPDAIVMGTAMFLDMPVLTADKDFAKVTDLQLFLYEP